MSSATQTIYRKYSARLFGHGGMVCPHCEAKMKESAESCARCGFDLDYCKEAFPFAPPPLSLLIDPSKLLPGRLENELARPYRKFRKRFPQVELSFCFVQLQPAIRIQEFSFWLHNSAPEADEQRGWQLLLVTDLTSGRITLTPGYALEPFVRPESWEAALQDLALLFSEKRWKEGLTDFLKDADDLLGTAWMTAMEKASSCAERKEPSS